MARRSEHSREELRDMALAAAAELVAKAGPAGLTTRAVAARIGYTVGSLYLVFRNLDDLILQLNARTLDALYAAVQGAVAAAPAPAERLLALAHAYIRFAYEHRAAWRLVFEHPLPKQTPPWFQERVRRMFALVEAPLAALAVRRSAREIEQAARALWSGVHGVCVLGLTGRLDETGSASVQELARVLVGHYLAGFTGRRPAPVARKRPRT
jgi:AcrR family transcriptional regulator